MIFTEEQELFRQSVRQFAENELAPLVPQILETNTYPPELLKKAGELGFLGLNYPEEWGGGGLGRVETCIYFEEICKVCPGFALSTEILLVSGSHFKSADIRDKYLPGLLAGEYALGSGATPPTGQANGAESKLTFTKTEGGYLVNGSRLYATNHDDKVGYLYGPDEEGNTRYGFWERDMEGVEVVPNDKKIGQAGNNGGTVIFKDVFIPEEMTGTTSVGDGDTYYEVYCGCSAEAVGCAKGLYEKTEEFCKTRTHNFKPLTELSGVKEKLAELKMKIYMAEAMVYTCASLEDTYNAQGRTDDALGQRWRETAVATKVQVSELLAPVAYECIKLHGGLGYHDPMVWHYLGDQLNYTHMDITNEIHYGSMAALMGL